MCVALIAVVAAMLPTAAFAQKLTIEELLRPHDAKTRVEPAPPSSDRDQLVVLVLVGVLGVLIIGSAIYRFRRRRTQPKQPEKDRDFPVERDRVEPLINLSRRLTPSEVQRLEQRSHTRL